MVIKKLILFRYKRLFLSNIETLEYTPEQNIQLILGGNGQGKSSLLYMLTPVPPDLKREFNEGGYKIIEIEHNNSYYILSSGGELGNKHSFLFNNTELNQGGTKSVQIELVKEHFQVTGYIHSILLGNTKFTSMPAVERKKVFSDISNIDYTYPLRVYNELRQRHRDIVGGIKILQENILKIKSTVIEDKELERYKTNLVMLSNYVEYLISLYKHDVDRAVDLDSMYDKLNVANREITKIYSSNAGLLTVNVNDIKSKISILENEIIFYNSSITAIKDKLSSFDTKALKSEEELTHEILNITKLISESKLTIDGVTLDNVENIYSVINDTYFEVIGVLARLDEYKNINKDNSEMVKLMSSVDIASKEYKAKETRYNLIVKELEHIEKHKTDENKVSCKQCGNSWYHHFDQDNQKILLRDKDILKVELDKLRTYIDSNSLVLTTYNEYKELVKELHTYSLSIPLVRPIWTYILTETNLKESSASVVNKLNMVKNRLEEWCSIAEKSKQLKMLEKDLENIKTINKIIKENNLKNIEELETNLSSYIKVVYSKQQEIIGYNKLISDLTKIEKAHFELRTTLKNINRGIGVTVDQVRNKYITDLVSQLKQQMAEIEQRIASNNTYVNKITNDTNEIEILTTKEKVLKLLVKELSPSEGIIAKSINSFLNNYIRDMNNIISKVWSYDIEILPSTISEGSDLDYKFPVRVDGSEVIEDVSKLSSSMQEIVDLAFKIVFIKYSKIIDAPLILDEFARTFDKHHRVKAYDIIESIFAGHFKQIFMVSHFESMYGRFTNSDINILGDPSMYGDVKSVNANMKLTTI